MVLIDIKTATITSRGQIAIPKSIRKAGGFNVGSKIAILAYSDRIEIRTMDQIKDQWVPPLPKKPELMKKEVGQKEENYNHPQTEPQKLQPMPLPRPPKRPRKKGWRFI
jgi:AbrB family looped-hinge helix DNA binding protein